MPDTAKFRSDKGTEFAVERLDNGLYRIRMLRGGKAPSICEEFFTSNQFATMALERYLSINDRLGDARYPSKDK